MTSSSTIVETLTNIQPVNENIKKTYKWEVVWTNVFLLFALHLGALYGGYLRQYATSSTFIFAKIYALLAPIGTTAGAHRLWSHKSYKVKLPLEIFLAFLVSTTYQNSIYNWCRDHRVHHRFSETDADPHNAKRGFFFSHMGWLMLKKHKDVTKLGKNVDMSDLESNPVVMFQHRYYFLIVFIFAGFIPVFIPWYFYGESFAICFFSVMIYRYALQLHFTWVVNSFAHFYGNKPYDKYIGPCENNVAMYVALGEGFHNYHHTFPWDYKTGEFGNDFRNLTTQIINGFAKLGWAYDLRAAPNDIIMEMIRKSGDDTRTKFYIRKNDTWFQCVFFHIVNILNLIIVLWFLHVC